MSTKNWTAIAAEVTTSRDAVFCCFDSLGEAVWAHRGEVAAAVGRLRKGEVDANLTYVPCSSYGFVCGSVRIVFRDELGLVIPLWRIAVVWAQAVGENRASFGPRRFTGAVPGTGRRHRWHYFRNIRTVQERRATAYVDEDEIGTPWRAGRRPWALPSNYDDIPRSIERNWKAFRRNQWKDN